MGAAGAVAPLTMNPTHLTEPANLGLLMMLVAVVVGGLGIYRLVLWVRAAAPKPDPWGDELERSLQSPEAIPVCHHCFTPCPPRGWFCENCGCAVGPYNNWMPYLYVFSEGEVLRNGVTSRLPINFLTIGGYLLGAMGCLALMPLFAVLLPFYLWRVFKNLSRPAGEAVQQAVEYPPANGT